jgi:hypothetical protein
MRLRVALAIESFKTDTVRLAGRSLAGATHIMASRTGLYAVNEREWTLLAHGFFFGITLRGDDIFAFESCDQPHSAVPHGRIVRLARRGDTITGASVVAKGLDNGCHQIDFLDGRLHVVDTYRQQILRYSEDLRVQEIISPLPVEPTGRWASGDPRYVHANSILQVGERILLLLHNHSTHTGRQSEVVVYDLDWRERERWHLAGKNCHGLALLEDGSLLVCDTADGSLIDLRGLRVAVSADLTRGLAVGEDTIAVGASPEAAREARLTSAGTITFLDRAYKVRTVLAVPAAPTEVRRLDGKDHGLSSYLRQVAWGGRVKGPASSAG